MALDDKNILITPNTGTANEPKIEFTGADASGNDTITLSASYDGTVSTLSFEASTGQLFSVANIDSDGDGYSFSINDNSGIPAVLVELDGTIQLNPNTGNVLIGTSTDDGSNLLQVNGDTKLTGNVSGITDLYIDDQIISTGDTNTYLQFHAADQFRIVAGGSERIEITNVSPHVLITGNLKVSGDIEATGTLDAISQNDLSVTDRKITLNDGETLAGINGGAGGELAVSGIFIDRGTLDSASFVFNETVDAWQVRLNSAFDTPALGNLQADSIGATTINASTLIGNLNWSYIQDKPDPVVTVTLTGDVTGSGNTTLTDLTSGTISFATTIAANSVALGTDTTGAYVADIVQGDAISISETANNAEGNTVTINHADTSSVGNLSSDNANGTVLQDISFTFDTYGHTTAASVVTTNLDNRYIRSFQVEDGDGTEVTINQANEWKFVEGAGDGASIDINWTDVSNGTDADPYDLTFSVTNTDKGSAQNIFKTFTVDDTDTEYTWADTGSAVADTNADTLTFVSGNDFDVDVDATNDAIRFQHVDITRTDTTSTATPAYGGTFTVIDSLTTNARGHVTAANVKTVTIPASDNTNTTYDLSIIQTGGNDDNPAIRLAAGGSGSGNDDLTLTGGGAITITRTSATGLTIEHTDTSSQGSVDNSGNTFIQDITLDTYGHITGITSATTSIGNATITIAGGTDLQNTAGDFTTNQTGNETITINHSNITRTDTTSTATPAYGGTFTVIDSLTTNARGHVTAANVKTVTVPASDNTNTTYSISTVAGDDAVSEKIRLTAGGSGSGTDDIILAVAQTGTTDGLDISETGDTITFAHHDTSTLSGAQGSAGIASITVDEMGHVTAVTTATYNNYSHPTYTTRSINTSGVDVLDVFTSDTIGSVTNITTRTLPNATASVVGVVSTGAQDFGGVKTFKGGQIVVEGTSQPELTFNYVPADNAIGLNESLGRIEFKGTDESVQDTAVRIQATAYAEWGTSTDTTDAPGELSIWVTRDGTDTLYETLTINQAEVVVNEQSQDVDFRVESNVDQNAFFVRGSDGNIGLGTSAPNADLQISKATPDLRFANTTTNTDWDRGDIFGSIEFFTEGDVTSQIDAIQILNNQNIPYGGLSFRTGHDTTNPPTRMVIDHNGAITMFNELSSQGYSSLADTTTTDEKINLTLYQSSRRGAGTESDIRSPAILAGIGQASALPAYSDEDSDIFTIIAANGTTNPHYGANAAISLYLDKTADPANPGSGGIRFFTTYAENFPPTTLVESMRINALGKVGIGTNIIADSDKLYVKGGHLVVDADGTFNTAALRFVNDNERSRITSDYGTGGGGRMGFWTDTTGGTLVQRMTIDNTGNVGIRLTSPSDTLEVKASGNDDGIRLKGSSDDDLFWIHQQNTDGVTARMYHAGDLNIVLNSEGNQRARFNGTTGSYLTWEYGGATSMADIGTGNHVFGSGGKVNDFGITCRIGKLLFGSNGTDIDMMLDSSSDLHVKNDIIAFSTSLSDQRLKDDVKTLDKSLEKILQLRGVSFTWNAGSREGVRDIGVIAQEVETVIPEIVREKKAELIDGLPTKTVDYEKLVAVLIEGMKEQQSQIDELREEIQALKGE
jgi:hypothetical protein